MPSDVNQRIRQRIRQYALFYKFQSTPAVMDAINSVHANMSDHMKGPEKDRWEGGQEIRLDGVRDLLEVYKMEMVDLVEDRWRFFFDSTGNAK